MFARSFFLCRTVLCLFLHDTYKHSALCPQRSWNLISLPQSHKNSYVLSAIIQTWCRNIRSDIKKCLPITRQTHRTRHLWSVFICQDGVQINGRLWPLGPETYDVSCLIKMEGHAFLILICEKSPLGSDPCDVSYFLMYNAKSRGKKVVDRPLFYWLTELPKMYFRFNKILYMR